MRLARKICLSLRHFYFEKIPSGGMFIPPRPPYYFFSRKAVKNVCGVQVAEPPAEGV
jgi:hypothetical protein